MAGLLACRSDSPRAEATLKKSQTSQTSQTSTEAARSPDAVDAEVAPQTLSRRHAALPPPWWFTVELTSPPPGLRIVSMDIRSFAIPLLQCGDVVIAVDGRPARSAEEFEHYLQTRKPGVMVVFTVMRATKAIDYAMLQVPDNGPPP